MLGSEHFFVHIHYSIIIVPFNYTHAAHRGKRKGYIRRKCSSFVAAEAIQCIHRKRSAFRRNCVQNSFSIEPRVVTYHVHDSVSALYGKPGKCISKLMLFVHNCCQYIASVQSDWLGKNI